MFAGLSSSWLRTSSKFERVRLILSGVCCFSEKGLLAAALPEVLGEVSLNDCLEEKPLDEEREEDALPDGLDEGTLPDGLEDGTLPDGLDDGTLPDDLDAVLAGLDVDVSPLSEKALLMADDVLPDVEEIFLGEEEPVFSNGLFDAEGFLPTEGFLPPAGFLVLDAALPVFSVRAICFSVIISKLNGKAKVCHFNYFSYFYASKS